MDDDGLEIPDSDPGEIVIEEDEDEIVIEESQLTESTFNSTVGHRTMWNKCYTLCVRMSGYRA